MLSVCHTAAKTRSGTCRWTPGWHSWSSGRSP